MNIVLSFQRNVPKCLNHPYRPSTTMDHLQGDDYLYCDECNYKSSKSASELKRAVVFNDDYNVRPGKRQKMQQKSKKTLVKRLRDEWEK